MAHETYITYTAPRNLQEKAEEINLTLLQPDVDLWKLRELALSEGGLVNDTLRKRAWPKLAGLHKYYHHKHPQPKPTTTAATMTTSKLPTLVDDNTPKFEIDASLLKPKTTDVIKPDLIAASLDVAQIERDVARCTWHLLTGTQRSRRVQYHNKNRRKVSTLLKKKQRRLANLINVTLVDSYALAPCEDDRLRYYQGYHDVACIFLHALGGGNEKPNAKNNTTIQQQPPEDRMGLELPARVLCQVSHSHFRDNMRPNFLSLQTALKVALFPLLRKLDRTVHNHLKDCDMEPFFCLSWVLTWFAHDVRDTKVVKRLFDAFLVSHPLFCLYVSIAMMLHPLNRTLILQTDCDFAALHQCLAMLPRNSCRVGFKQRWDGSGFEDDEEGDDDRTVSTDMDSNWDNSFRDTSSFGTNNGGGELEKSMSLATSATIANSSSSASLQSSCHSFSVGPISVESSYDRVPFQTLIDKALGYMKRYPPRCLMELAQQYYKDEQSWEGLNAQQLSNVSLLQHPPPLWSLAATAKADWVLKQRVRQDLGLKATSRKDRRKKLQYTATQTNHSSENEKTTPLVDKEYLKRHQRSRAVIAAGYGPDPMNEKDRKRRRKQRVMMAGAVAVGVVAVLIAVAYLYHTNTNTNTPVPAKAGEDYLPNSTTVASSSDAVAPDVTTCAGDLVETPNVATVVSAPKVVNVASSRGVKEAPVPFVAGKDSTSESKNTVQTKKVSEQTIDRKREQTTATTTTTTTTTVERAKTIVPQTETGTVAHKRMAPSLITETTATVVPVHQTMEPSPPELPPAIVIRTDTKTATIFEKLLSAEEPLSAKKSPPLVILEKMTLSLYRFMYHLFRPLRLFLHKEESSEAEDQKGILKVVLGGFGTMWKQIPATPKKIPQM